MLDLQRNILLAAIGAGACPLLQQRGSQFVAEKGPLLVLDSLNLWILHLLKIKVEGLLDLLAAVRKLGSKDHFA
jgi:hypothetical protein